MKLTYAWQYSIFSGKLTRERALNKFLGLARGLFGDGGLIERGAKWRVSGRSSFQLLL